MVSAKDKRSLYRDFSGYVNVCAAVCLLLLVGGLSPRSSAAPHRSRATMDRQRRDTEENKWWGNPCDYDNNTNSKTEFAADHVRNASRKIASVAKTARDSAYTYSESFAKMHGYPTFSANLLRDWESEYWLRKSPYGEALPKEKVLDSKMPDKHIEDLMENIDEKLPQMYMALKVVVAGLHIFSENALSENIPTDDTLKENMNKTMHDVRQVLCYFHGIMEDRKLVIKQLDEHEVKDLKDDMSYGLLLYRDTLNYLEYLIQVFEKLAIKEEQKLATKAV
ncbi:uncharacterized protein LOC142976098 isoform X2 [Anticarsia gemmatalis]|uniref:uncharacterized protein LOC142976098 isoform X2 n=1 Tax=Anticarsia gemmatalis TaxID=129554 RepID=UPI003F75DE7D